MTLGALVFVLVGLVMKFSIGFSGRVLTLLDPTYAKNHIPIIASVAEHQTTT